MKTTYLLFSLLLSASLLPSCKKSIDDESNISKSIKVRYELTTSLPAGVDPSGTFTNRILYANSTMNVDNVTFTGKSWIKELVIQTPIKGEPLYFEAMLALQGINGTANCKIFINDKIKGESNQSVASNLNGITLLSIITYCPTE